MLSWGTIIYGAVLSGVAAALLTYAAVRRDRRLDLVAASAVSATLGAFLWNAILHRVEGREFFVDAPVAVMPASWQDTGSGVFAVAVAALVIGFGPGREESGRRVAALSLMTGVAAFLVDVYLY